MIIGLHDLCGTCHNYKVNKYLENAGFKNLKDDYSIRINNKTLQGSYDLLKRANKEFSTPDVQKYCYEKP